MTLLFVGEGLHSIYSCYSVCVRVCLSVHVYMGMCSCVEDRGQCQVSILSSLRLYFFQGLSLNLELTTWLGWLEL